MAARSHHPIGSLLETDPTKAAVQLSAKLKAHKGAIPATAEALGVNGATLRRWIQRLRDQGIDVGPVRGPGKPRRKRAASKAHEEKRC